MLLMSSNEESLAKAKFHFESQLGELLYPLRRYGQEVYVEQVLPEITKIAVQFHRRLAGEDIPILADRIRYTP